MNRKPKVSKENLQTAKRLLKYVTGTYKVRFVIVFICILLSSIASISVSLSLKFLIDDFISPLIGQKDPNFAELYRALAVLGSIFLMGTAQAQRRVFFFVQFKVVCLFVSTDIQGTDNVKLRFPVPLCCHALNPVAGVLVKNERCG